MPFYNPIRLGASGVTEDFTVDRSLRFNSGDNTELSRTPSGAGNRKTWTLSFWAKIASDDLGSHGFLFSTGANANNKVQINLESSNRLAFEAKSGGSTQALVRPSNNLRDPTAWYHFVIRVDTTDSTSTNRIKIYINGEQQTDLSQNTFPSQHTEFEWNKAQEHNIGRRTYSSNFYNGYLAEINFIDGTALTPSSFAETNSTTGQWVPKNTAGLTYGTNGFRLQFADNSGTSATTLGKDTSGNSNNYTPSNFNVTNNSVENDSVLDTPTNNWCTMNPLTGFWDQSGSLDLETDGLLHGDNPNSGDRANHATFRLQSGKKYYIEGVYLEPSGGGSQCKWGITTVDGTGKSGGHASKPQGTGGFGIDWRGGAGTTQSHDEGSTSNIGSRPSNGTVIGVAIDLVNGKFYAHQGNTYYNSGDPDNGTGAIITGIPTGVEYNFTASADSGGPNFSEYKINFGQQGFQHQPTTFTDVLNSQSLDDPAISFPNKHFGTILYTGTGSSNSVSDSTQVNFTPDWVWIKKRSNSENNEIQDAVRGATKRLSTNASDAESTVAGSISSFNSNGFTVVDAGTTNESGETYVAWCWNAGGSTATNNDGSIASQVRANTTAGISIVTANGSSGSTIGHGLGVQPDLIIEKDRDNSQLWRVFHYQMGGSDSYGAVSDNLHLNSNAGFPPSLGAATRIRNVTNSVFESFGGFSGSKQVFYCITSVKGFSKVGLYEGNGQNDGEFVHTGFRPAWIIIKSTASSEHWRIFDNQRSPFNQVNKHAFASNNSAESTETGMDFLANGFKLRDSDGHQNTNGHNYIYWAFAQAPYKYARAV